MQHCSEHHFRSCSVAINVDILICGYVCILCFSSIQFGSVSLSFSVSYNNSRKYFQIQISRVPSQFTPYNSAQLRPIANGTLLYMIYDNNNTQRYIFNYIQNNDNNWDAIISVEIVKSYTEEEEEMEMHVFALINSICRQLCLVAPNPNGWRAHKNTIWRVSEWVPTKKKKTSKSFRFVSSGRQANMHIHNYISRHCRDMMMIVITLISRLFQICVLQCCQLSIFILSSSVNLSLSVSLSLSFCHHKRRECINICFIVINIYILCCVWLSFCSNFIGQSTTI